MEPMKSAMEAAVGGGFAGGDVLGTSRSYGAPSRCTAASSVEFGRSSAACSSAVGTLPRPGAASVLLAAHSSVGAQPCSAASAAVASLPPSRGPWA